MLALIIDDSRAMRRMLARTLKELGFTVEEAGDGKEALAVLKSIAVPDLMLVDWNMPEMNGIQFLQAVRNDPKYDNAKIMMVTTETGIDRVGEALNQGANEYLMKPFTQEALRAKLGLIGITASAAAAPVSAAGEKKLKVLLVDDSSVVRRLVGSVIAGEPDMEIETAEDGKIGLQKIEEYRPDVVLLDVEMPVMDGLTTLRKLREKWIRLPVIMFSTLTERGASITLTALASGASAYITKPSGMADINAAMSELRVALCEQIRSLCRRPCKAAPAPARTVTTAPPPVREPARGGKVEAIIIAASTGGPAALAAVLPRLPANLGAPVFLVQHMPELFTAMLAKSLDEKSPLTVVEGEAGKVVAPGQVWVAPGGRHMEVRNTGANLEIAIHEGPREQSVRPAADVLFRSAVEVFGGNVLAVVLTGMGRDGLAGCEAVAEAGGQIIVQDEATSVVWGMPGFVARAGLANAVLPLDAIAAEISRRTPLAAPAAR